MMCCVKDKGNDDDVETQSQNAINHSFGVFVNIKVQMNQGRVQEISHMKTFQKNRFTIEANKRPY